MFELGQLLIWMLEEEAPRAHWSRPLRWKYARYSSGIGKGMFMSIRAFTAACSTDSVAPRDGTECVELLSTLFASRPGIEESEGIKSGAISRAKRRGAAKRLLSEHALATEITEIEGSAPLAQTVYAELKHTLLSVCEEIREEEPSLAISVDEEFHYRVAGATDLLWLVVLRFSAWPHRPLPGQLLSYLRRSLPARRLRCSPRWLLQAGDQVLRAPCVSMM